MADTTVKYFHSAMSGAPVLSGQAGALIAVLDACLKDGFGLGTLDSLVISGGVATATRAAGHSQEAGSVALIAGATVTGGSIDGEQKVLTATATTFTFAAALANQTATGTITQKLAPAGWSKTYSGTNLAAYKPDDVTATGCLLRVDDTGTTSSRVVGYETMSDVNTGTGPFPTAAQQSGGLYWSKSSTADSTARPWMLVADGKTVYFARVYLNSAPLDSELSAFGDFLSTKSGDAFGCLLNGMSSDMHANSVSATTNQYYQSTTSLTSVYVPRAYTGLGSSLGVSRNIPNPFYNSGVSSSGGGGTTTAFPNVTDGGLYLVNHYIAESSGAVFRGVSPGFYCVPQAVPAGSFATKDTLTGVAGYAGRTFKALSCQNAMPVTCFFDITGPWR